MTIYVHIDPPVIRTLGVTMKLSLIVSTGVNIACSTETIYSYRMFSTTMHQTAISMDNTAVIMGSVIL